MQHAQNQFLSNLFVVRKKYGGYCPVINIKTLDHFVPYKHIKTESLRTLKYMMKERDYMCKFDLKDVYFSVPLDKLCPYLLRFLWEGNLYEFLCLCVGLVPAPRIFTKFLKAPIPLLRRLNIRILI